MLNNMNDFMKKAQKMQKELLKNQELMQNKEYQASSGGDMVTVTINGAMQVKKITLSPDIVSREDVEMLEDLIVAAVNQAIEKAKKDSNDGLKGLTKGLQIPGLNL